MDFLKPKPEAFGLDISDTSVKLAKLERRRGFFHLSLAQTVALPSSAIEGGEIRNSRAVADALRGALERHTRALGRNFAVCALPEEKVFVQVIRMPKMNTEELAKAVAFEAENYVPFPIGEVYFDFARVPESKAGLDHTDVLIAACPRVVVDSYLALFREAGISPVAFEPASFALSRALIRGMSVFPPVLLLDIGSAKTILAIFSGSSLRFAAFVPIGSRNFSNAIAKELGVSQERAEKIKIQYGIAERKERDGKKVSEALRPTLSALAEQARQYLNYYASHAFHEHLGTKKKRVAIVYLCGGGANLSGIETFLSAELKIPVQSGSPWINIFPESPKEIPDVPYRESLKYAVALGLALRGAQ